MRTWLLLCMISVLLAASAHAESPLSRLAGKLTNRELTIENKKQYQNELSEAKKRALSATTELRQKIRKALDAAQKEYDQRVRDADERSYQKMVSRTAKRNSRDEERLAAKKKAQEERDADTSVLAIQNRKLLALEKTLENNSITTVHCKYDQLDVASRTCVTAFTSFLQSLDTSRKAASTGKSDNGEFSSLENEALASHFTAMRSFLEKPVGVTVLEAFDVSYRESINMMQQASDQESQDKYVTGIADLWLTALRESDVDPEVKSKADYWLKAAASISHDDKYAKAGAAPKATDDKNSVRVLSLKSVPDNRSSTKPSK